MFTLQDKLVKERSVDLSLASCGIDSLPLSDDMPAPVKPVIFNEWVTSFQYIM